MRLKQIYFKEQFRPGVLALFINPFYFARKGLIDAIRPFAAEIRGKTLDVGCGQKPYADLFASSEYIGLDRDTPETRRRNKADVYYDGDTFPFPGGGFDSVVCNQVLEHVFDPERFLSEINRILREGGVLLLSVPFVWDEHEQPFDYARYSSFGLKYLLENRGFRIVAQRKTQAGVAVIFQLINAYLYKIVVTRNSWLNLLATVLLMAPFNILGVILSKILPSNQDLYLDQIVFAVKEKSA